MNIDEAANCGGFSDALRCQFRPLLVRLSTGIALAE
jgi:hypothetical protein